MKANHNHFGNSPPSWYAVSSYAKLLKWKQITTYREVWKLRIGCKFLCKVTKMKANHNYLSALLLLLPAVSSYAKLLKWKQITTCCTSKRILQCCKFLCKVTKMKANHNAASKWEIYINAVSSYAKLLKWKQITTVALTVMKSFQL